MAGGIEPGRHEGGDPIPEDRTNLARAITMRLRDRKGTRMLALALLANGAKPADVARDLGFARATIYRWLRQSREQPQAEVGAGAQDKPRRKRSLPAPKSAAILEL